MQYASKCNPEILALVDFISARDPGALVILMGDHGGMLLRHSITGNGDINAVLDRSGINRTDFALDCFNIMLAVKWPAGTGYEGTVSPVNLFRIVFSVLSEKTSGEKAPDESYYLRDGVLYTAVRDGVVLPSWEPSAVQSRGY